MKKILTILLGLILLSNFVGIVCAESDEDFDLMFHEDGSLRDPVPGDGYTAEQSYWILNWALFSVFIVWAGIGTRNPIVATLALIICVIWALVIFSW